MNKNVKGILIILSVFMLVFSCSDLSDVKMEIEANDDNEFPGGTETILSEMNGFAASDTENSRQDEYINVALGKNAYAKSSYHDEHSPEKLTDGNEATIWGSSNLDDSDQWIYIDLGESMEISGIGLKWYVYNYKDEKNSKSYHAQKIAIWTSNADNIEGKISSNDFELQYIIENCTGNGPDGIQNIISSSSVTCRYVAVYLSDRNTNINVYGLKEFEVYKKK